MAGAGAPYRSLGNGHVVLTVNTTWHMEPINNLLGSCWSFVSLQPRDIEILFGAESVQFRVSESCGGPCWLVGAMLAVPSLEQLEPPHGTVGNSNWQYKTRGGEVQQHGQRTWLRSFPLAPLGRPLL